MSALESEPNERKVMSRFQLHDRLRIDYDIVDSLSAEKKVINKRLGEIDETLPIIWQDMIEVVDKLRERGQRGVLWRVTNESRTR